MKQFHRKIATMYVNITRKFVLWTYLNVKHFFLLRFANHLSNQVFKETNFWQHRPRNFPTASGYKELCRQSAIPTCPMYHRYLYVSFSKFSEERIRGNRRSTSNKRVCSRDIEGQQRKESVVSNKRISLSQAAKCKRSGYKYTRSQNINCYIFVLIINR